MVDCAGDTAPTQQHELDPTGTDQEPIFPEISRSSSGNRWIADDLAEVWNISDQWSMISRSDWPRARVSCYSSRAQQRPSTIFSNT